MNNNNKIKYFLEIGALAFVFLLMSPVYASEITSNSVIKFVNESRQENGLPELVANEKLMQVAKDKLNDMIKFDYFAHTSPQGIEPWSWFSKNEYDYQFAGENLAINFLTVEAQHKAWMESPTHKKNILNPNYSEIGVAVGAGKINGQDSIIAVQEFGLKAGSTVPMNDKNNFSVNKNKNLIEESEKIAPQVLSAKNIQPSRSDQVLNKMNANENLEVIEWMSTMLTLVILATVAFSPLVLILVSERIMNIWKDKKYKGELLNQM